MQHINSRPEWYETSDENVMISHSIRRLQPNIREKRIEFTMEFSFDTSQSISLISENIEHKYIELMTPRIAQCHIMTIYGQTKPH